MMIFNVITKSAVRIMFPMELKRYQFYMKPIIRLCLITVFVISTFSITVSWTSVISLILLLASYLFFKSKDDNDGKRTVAIETIDLDNPYKGKTGSGHLTPEKMIEIAAAIENYVVYDAGDTKSLKRFETLKSGSECVFAKRAKLWGSSDYDESTTIEENMRRVYPTLLKFTLAFMDLGLSGFVIELPGNSFGADIEVFGKAVQRVLSTLKLEDRTRIDKQRLKEKKGGQSAQFENTGEPNMKPSSEDTKLWDRKGWVYEINKITFFITTFAPFYPETNSRYNFGCKDCYILLQPEISFAIHDLPPDTPDTNWTRPVTVRDRIRVAFHKAGRYYEPPMKIEEPMVYDIVKRVYPEDEQMRWWNFNGKDAKID